MDISRPRNLMESSIRQWTISKAGCEGAHENTKSRKRAARRAIE